jgi:myo-inositol 2-dehydrogenase/D-chiro-inositol 1-dehydrogenase
VTLQVGIIGTGGFSQMHGRILSNLEDVRVQAFFGTSLDKAQKAAASFEYAKGYDNLTTMLDAERLDAVYICVPPMAHGEIEMKLIERNIPFLVEKPLGVNTEIPQQILTGIEQKSLLTSVGYHFRYKDTTRILKETLDTQAIGMAVGEWMSGMPLVPWWRRQEGSGGQFIEQTTHMVDLLRYCAGEIDEVYASYANRVMHNQHDHVTVPDVGTITLKLKSGVIANISNTCILPKGVSRIGLTFYTGEGTLNWNPNRLEITGADGLTEYKDSEDPYVAENLAFLHGVRTGDSSLILSNYADSFKTQMVTYAALESAASGLPVKLT